MRLIDADVLMKAIENAFENVTVYDVEPYEAVNDFERIVDSVPTIEERPKGKWIGFRTGNGLICVKCSECKTAYGFLKTPFCPNCGADMRGDNK